MPQDHHPLYDERITVVFYKVLVQESESVIGGIRPKLHSSNLRLHKILIPVFSHTSGNMELILPSAR